MRPPVLVTSSVTQLYCLLLCKSTLSSGRQDFWLLTFPPPQLPLEPLPPTEVIVLSSRLVLAVLPQVAPLLPDRLGGGKESTLLRLLVSPDFLSQAKLDKTPKT